MARSSRLLERAEASEKCAFFFSMNFHENLVLNYRDRCLIAGSVTCYKDRFQPPGGYRIFNTWMGDPCKALLFRAVVRTIKEENLLDRVLLICLWIGQPQN